MKIQVSTVPPLQMILNLHYSTDLLFGSHKLHRPNRFTLSKVCTGFARSSPSRSRCIYGCDTLRCSCCLRYPYRVMPPRACTPTGSEENTPRPPTEWSSEHPRTWRSVMDVVGSAAMLAITNCLRVLQQDDGVKVSITMFY